MRSTNDLVDLSLIRPSYQAAPLKIFLLNLTLSKFRINSADNVDRIQRTEQIENHQTENNHKTKNVNISNVPIISLHRSNVLNILRQIKARF